MPDMPPAHEDSTLSRRTALKRALHGALAAALAPAASASLPPTALAPEPEFVPENDYPFFGGELPEGFAEK